MKRNLLLTLILVALAAFFTTNLYGQTTKYTGGTIEYSVNGKTKPIGKNVTVTFDSFFKSYVVTYTDINGYKNKLTFEYENASRYSCNGVLYDCILCEVGLNPVYTKNGNGFITFSDLRKFTYGGTGQSYSIKKLSISK